MGDTKKYKTFPWLVISNMDEQRLIGCEEMTIIVPPFSRRLTEVKLAFNFSAG